MTQEPDTSPDIAGVESALIALPSAISGAQIMERVAISGDLSMLTPNERVAYYVRVCESLGLNPLTKPFDYIWLGKGEQRKLTLYAKRDATDQIRRNVGVSIVRLEYPTTPDGLFGVVAYGRDRSGREDSASGIVNIKGLGGEDLANAMMKAETKAKRRLTLSLAGLGLPDETEVASIPDAETVDVDANGNVKAVPSLAERIVAKAKAIQAPATVEEIMAGESMPVKVENVEVTTVTEEPDAATEPNEAPVTVDTATPTDGEALRQFSAWVGDRDKTVIKAAAKAMFPDAKNMRELSLADLDALRASLLERERAEATAQPVLVATLDAEEVETELLAEVREAPGIDPSVVERDERDPFPKPTLCNHHSPFTDSVCNLDEGHSGAHRAGLRETW